MSWTTGLRSRRSLLVVTRWTSRCLLRTTTATYSAHPTYTGLSCASASLTTWRTCGLSARRQVMTLSPTRSEEHTSELQSRGHLVCRLLLEKKKEIYMHGITPCTTH